jgi:hypothetical protein
MMDRRYLTFMFILVLLLLITATKCTGPQGPAGPSGKSGPTGLAGPTGNTGSQGTGAGLLSTQEPNACNGAGGVQIITFVDPANTGIYEAGDGITSTSLVCNGTNGTNGASSTVSLSAANVIECPTGGVVVTSTNGDAAPTSYFVCNGQVGATGSQGATGPQGVQGVAGNSITVVQFCPGTTTYPSKFTEVGLCLNNVLYAVYSLNDGFLTEVVPGTYSSDGVNSSCTFTVGPNCAVTQN